VLAIADRLGYRTNRTASPLARRRSRMLGVTVTPSNPFHAELVEEIQRVADLRGYEVGLGAVTPSHDERQVIDHLVSLGHRRIAHADDDGFVSAERCRAYAEAMAHHGLEPLTLPGGETEPDGIRAAEALDPRGRSHRRRGLQRSVRDRRARLFRPGRHRRAGADDGHRI